MSGWGLLAVGAVVALIDFFVGLRFSRMTVDQLQPNRDGSRPTSAEPVNRLGRLMMTVAAPLFFLVFALLAFGLIPAGGIDPIRFN